MKIQYCSDLHLEFAVNHRYMNEHPLTPVGDILLLAGDIVSFPKLDDTKHFFDFLSASFKAVYWVPGNHEYYGFKMPEKTGSFMEPIRENVWLINNKVVQLEGIDFIFSTMWTYIPPFNHRDIQQGLADFQVIQFGQRRFNPDDVNMLHDQCLEFLQSALAENQDHSKKVVVTHHVPTFINYPPEYGTSLLNNAFGVELYEFIGLKGPACWIYGHHHRNVDTFTIGQTRLLTNQLGYVQANEHRTFNPLAFIELT